MMEHSNGMVVYGDAQAAADWHKINWFEFKNRRGENPRRLGVMDDYFGVTVEPSPVRSTSNALVGSE